MNQPVQQQWIFNLPWKMQTVINQGLRAPDTHFCPNIKIAARWLRSVVLNNADDTHTFMCRKEKLPEWDALENELNYCSMHYATHFLYALEIVAYKHPDSDTRRRASVLYTNLVGSMCHFNVETEEQLDVRLADNTEVPKMEQMVKEMIKEYKPPSECPSGRGDNYLYRG